MENLSEFLEKRFITACKDLFVEYNDIRLVTTSVISGKSMLFVQLTVLEKLGKDEKRLPKVIKKDVYPIVEFLSVVIPNRINETNAGDIFNTPAYISSNIIKRYVTYGLSSGITSACENIETALFEPEVIV